MKYLVLALLVVALILSVRCMTIRKDLVAERETIGTDWEQVNSALEQRAAIIPNVTQAVQAQIPAGVHSETAAVVAVNDARNALSRAPGQHEKIQANARLDEALARLMLLVEGYPKLEGSKQYGDLLEALKGADYQIAVARRKYNEAVEHYNARIEMFPNNIVASVSRLGKIDAYFQTPAI
jgi:LemA protein